MRHPPSRALSPRKSPQQLRSRDTVATILEAAARVFEESGIERATTNAIAARAGVSVGSLYQYFPNKLAVVRALIDRYQGDLRQVWDEVLTTRRAPRPLADTVGEAIDAVWHLAGKRPAFLAVLHSGRVDRAFAPMESRLLAEARSRIAGVGLAREPALSTEDALRISAVVSEMVHALLALAAGAPRAQRPRFIEEAKRAVASYLDAALPLRARPGTAAAWRGLARQAARRS